MTIDLIHSTSSSHLFNATCGLRVPTGCAIRARSDFSRLQANSHPAALWYRREPMTVVSEFHTSDHTGPFVTIGVQA